MSANPHAAQLVTAIDELLSGLHVYRKLPRPSTRDYDELVEERHRKVTHLAVAAGFDLPPGLAGAGFRVRNPFDIAAWPPNPPPNWRSPNANAGEALEGALRDLQAKARAASELQAATLGPKPERSESAPTLDERALALFFADCNRTKTQIAHLLGLKNVQSLSPQRCPKLHQAMEACRAANASPPRGTKDAEGNLEAWDEGE
jgi:hypothetical protein